ncbi:Cof-type HAD-IIB family hydrolase [Leifsonia aquatica]|uniref:Cof-type HAD-IIB family hydrolase n=1 Tax=Leifsonia aquatica TaxID=144185 RepID=UPI0004689408|nr:Cof-type HAD-IIB family hydrolase [Leifsonia aquatica]
MPPEPRLIVTDLDGTLLTSDRRITPRTIDVLGSARAAGLRLAIASARPHRLIDGVLPREALDLFDAVIVSNGAAVVDPRSGVVLHEDTLSAEAAGWAVRTLRDAFPGSGFGWEAEAVFSSDRVFLELVAREPILRDPHPDRVHDAPPSPVHQLVMAAPGMLPRAAVSRAAALLGTGFAVTDSSGGVVEISPSTVDKRSGAHWWASALGAGLDDVIAFGDELNDLPLLRAAGIGVAMANASDEVRAAASHGTASNDADGVAEFLATEVLA